MEDEVVEEFASSLRELNTNSKPLINMLTMLAEDNEQYASHIVQVIESHMNEDSQRMKLPCLYLIDSIIKNLPSSTYRSLFAHNIVSVFCDMFEKVDEKTRQCMFKVRQTWNDIFPNRKLYAIDVRVNLVDPAWPITAQPPVEPGSIHVNPRFITAKPPVADSPPVSDSPILEEPEDQEAILRQQIIEKQQEFLKLQQKQLELELEQLKQNKHHLGDTHSNVAVTVDSSSLDSSSPSVPVASTSTSAPVSTTAVIPKDPRMRDPRLRGQSLMPKVTASDASSVPSSFPLPTSAEQAPLPHREFPNAQNYMGFGHHHGPIHNTTHNEMPSWKNTFGHHHAPNSHPGRAGQGLLPFPSSSHPNSEFHPGWDRNNQAFTSARGRGRMHDTDQRSRKNDGKPSHSSSLGSGGKGSFRKDPRLERNDSSSGKKSISPKNKSEASKDTSSKTDVSSKSPSKSSSSKSLEKRHDAHPKKGKDIDASSKKEENVTKNQKSSNTKSSQKKGSTSSHGDLKSSKKSSKDSTESKRKSSSKDDPEKEGKKVSKSSSSSSTTSTSSSKSTSKGKSHSKHSSMERSPSPKKSKTETERKESPEKSVTDVKVEGKNKTGKNDTENEVKMDAVEENKGKRRLSGSDTGVSDDEKSVAKKAKVEESSVSDDITDLFGMEDQDYRSGPSVPAKSPFHQKWAEFRQENPDEFTYEIEHEKSKESLVGEKGASMEEDVDLRSNISASMLQEEIRKVEIPDALTMEHRMDIMQQIEERRRSGELSHEQHQEILRQLAQLDEIQKKQRYFSQLSEGKASNQDTDDRKHPPEKNQSNFSGLHSEDSRTSFDGKLEKPNVTVSENSMDGMKHNTQISHVKMEPHNEKGRFQKGFEHRDNEDNSRDRFPKKEWQDSDYDTRRQHENFPDRHKGFEDRRSSPSDVPYMSDNRREPPREFERNVPKEFEDRRYNVQHRYREDPGEFNERHGPPPRNYAPHDQVRDYDDRARHSWGSSGGEFKDGRPPRDFQPKDGRNNFEERPPFPRDFREGGGFHNRDNFDRGHGPHGFGGPEFDHRNKTNFPNYARGNDPRWFRVVGMLGPEDTEEFVINGRPYEIIVGKPARRIKLGQMTIEVYADPNARAIRVDGRIVYNFGDFVQSVPIRGINYKVFYHGKPRLVWIDGILHELRVDAPPKIIKVKDKEHIVKIDGRDNMILIDKNEVGKFGGPPIYAFIDNSRVELRFEAPPRKILIDGKMCELKLNCKIPCVMINGKPHGIRFEGPPRDIIINGVPYRVHMERPAKVRINGKPIYVAFGGPAHEVIMDGRWFEVKFNGPAKEVNIGNRTFKVELHGPPPGVKILNELTPPEPEPVHDAPNVPPRAVPMPPFSGAPGFRPSGPPPRMPDNMPVFGTNVMQSDPRLPLGGPVMNPVLMNQPGLLPLPQPQGSVGMPMQLMSASANVGMNTTAATTMPNPQIISTSHVNIPSNQPGMLPNFGNVFMNPNPAPAANNAPPLDVSTLLKRLMETGVIKTSSEKPADTPSQAPAAPADTQDTQEKPEFEIKPKKLDPVPNLKDFRLETLRKRYEGVIQQLYSGIQCQSCGLRFTAQQTNKYREHLDWHFRQNKRDKADAKVTRFRRWYYQISDWTEYEEIDESEDKGKSDVFEKIMAATGLASKSQTQAPQQSQAPEMPVFGPDAVHCPPATGDENGDICEICKDPFEQFWNEEEEEWHLKDAVRVDGKTYHPVCYEDEHEGGITETSPTPTPSTSGGVNPLILQIQQELGEVPSTQRIDWSSVREIKTARVIEDDADDLVQNETPEVKPELKVEEIKSEVENGTTEQSASPTENESDGKEGSNITVSAVTIKTEIDLDNIKKEPEAEAS